MKQAMLSAVLALVAMPVFAHVGEHRHFAFLSGLLHMLKEHFLPLLLLLIVAIAGYKLLLSSKSK